MTIDAIPQDRRAAGHARRKQLRRQEHCTWDPKLRRHNPLVLLERSMKGRVPALVPLKYERMAASPFGFFRGAVPIMAADLSLLPNTTIVSQLCGDAHVRNLGAYAAPDGRLVFDINDFDETIRGPFEWDLKRLATSLVLAGRATRAKDSFCKEAVTAFIQRYRKSVRTFSRMPVVEMTHYQVHRLGSVFPISTVLMKAERSTALHTLVTVTVPTASASTPATAKPETGKSKAPKSKAPKSKTPRSKTPAKKPAPCPETPRIFKEHGPEVTRLTASQARPVLASLSEYCEHLLPERQHFLAQYRPVDVCFRVVGTGSVGTRDYCIYFEGNGPCDPLFLQVKEEPGSAYLPYLDHGDEPRHRGRIVADGQRAMQFASDPFLGWTTIANRDYIVRQLNDHKASIEVDDLQGQGLIAYAEVCGDLLARGHSRSGDPQMMTGYLGNAESFGNAIAAFAVAYADQTEADWHRLLKSKHAPAITTPAYAKAANKTTNKA